MSNHIFRLYIFIIFKVDYSHLEVLSDDPSSYFFLLHLVTIDVSTSIGPLSRSTNGPIFKLSSSFPITVIFASLSSFSFAMSSIQIPREGPDQVNYPATIPPVMVILIHTPFLSSRMPTYLIFPAAKYPSLGCVWAIIHATHALSARQV